MLWQQKLSFCLKNTGFCLNCAALTFPVGLQTCWSNKSLFNSSSNYNIFFPYFRNKTRILTSVLQNQVSFQVDSIWYIYLCLNVLFMDRVVWWSSRYHILCRWELCHCYIPCYNKRFWWRGWAFYHMSMLHILFSCTEMFVNFNGAL